MHRQRSRKFASCALAPCPPLRELRSVNIRFKRITLRRLLAGIIGHESFVVHNLRGHQPDPVHGVHNMKHTRQYMKRKRVDEAR